MKEHSEESLVDWRDSAKYFAKALIGAASFPLAILMAVSAEHALNTSSETITRSAQRILENYPDAIVYFNTTVLALKAHETFEIDPNTALGFIRMLASLAITGAGLIARGDIQRIKKIINR